MTSIEIRYYALLREEAGRESELVEADCETYGELYEKLAHLRSFTLPKEMIQVAVNDEFSSLSAKIEPGATVVFIPPVAGG